MTDEEREAWREKERAYDKARRQTPEYKAYDKAYKQIITQQSAARDYMTALFAAQQFIQAIEQKP